LGDLSDRELDTPNSDDRRPAGHSAREQELELSRIVWDHLVPTDPLSKADVILALGSHDTRAAVHAARLWHEGWAPLVVVSGGNGTITAGSDETDTAVFARVARAHGVPGTPCSWRRRRGRSEWRG